MSIDISGVSLAITLPPQLTVAIADLSGAIHGGADLLRHAPALAAVAQKLDLPGAEKQRLVLAAAHDAIDRFVAADDRATAHSLVDAALPATIRAVLDVSKGRVTIGAAALSAAAAVATSEAGQVAAVGLLSRCLGCLVPPQPAAPQSRGSV
jgi:uncharacterized NAD(P)/FAD-binding protein YdhS